MSIRRIREKDIDPFFSVFKRCLRTQFPEYSNELINAFLRKYWSKRKYRNQVKNKNKLLLGAWVGKKLVGVLDANMPFGGVSFCAWIMVESEFQRRGVGRKLIAEWTRVVKKAGAHSIYLDADRRNRAYYKKLGFEEIGLWRGSWFGLDSLIYTKLIQKPRAKNYLR